jgi:hypothetical protein
LSISLLCGVLNGVQAVEVPVVQQEAKTVAAAYRVQLQSGKQPARTQTWYVIRDAKRIVIGKPGVEDIWRRNDTGQVSFERVFHDDKTVVEYAAGELATLGLSPNWLELGSLFDPAKLSQLKKVPATSQAGLTRYQGRLGHEQIQTIWLDAIGMPQSLVRTEHNRVVRFTLVKHFDQAPAEWPVMSQAIDDYARLDASDFGDMEYNPVVRKAMHLDVLAGWRTEHDHGEGHAH